MSPNFGCRSPFSNFAITDWPDLILDFADVESMELLSEVATEAVRLMHERVGAPA